MPDLQHIYVVIHKVIHNLWITCWKACISMLHTPDTPLKLATNRVCDKLRALYLVPLLQHFPEDTSTGRALLGRFYRGGVCWMGSVASDILTRLFEASGVPIEELYEAYVPAKPPEEGEDARFSPAHEHGWRPQGHRQPPPARSASARCLIVAKEQAHSPDRLPGVREGLPAGRRLQGQAVLCACFPQRVRDAAPGSLRLPEGRKRGDAQRGQAEAQGGLPRFPRRSSGKLGSRGIGTP